MMELLESFFVKFVNHPYCVNNFLFFPTLFMFFFPRFNNSGFAIPLFESASYNLISALFDSILFSILWQLFYISIYHLTEWHMYKISDEFQVRKPSSKALAFFCRCQTYDLVLQKSWFLCSRKHFRQKDWILYTLLN